MFTTKSVLAAALMLGVASGTLASAGGLNNNDAGMRAHAQATGGGWPRHKIAPKTFETNAYRFGPAPSQQPDAAWPRMNCDLPIGC
jgi:hypothetical protein